MYLDSMIGLVYFIYGTILGSFYNVVIYRVPKKISIAKGNSMCPHCGEKIKSKYLIPILSWIFLKGKSACCSQKISPYYAIGELTMGIMFLVSYILFGFSIASFYYIIFFSIIFLVGVIDWQSKTIYDAMLLIALILGVIMQLFFINDIKNSLVGGAIAFGFYFSIYLIVKLIYKEEKFGFGDVLFIALVGFFMGGNGILVTIFAPFYIAIFWFLIAKYILKKNLAGDSEVPFGPFISIAAFVLVVVRNI
ncbi:MAG: prepilin peptidase [Lachnospirales bacterium]